MDLGVLVDDIVRTLSSDSRDGLANGYIANISMESIGEGNKAVLVF